MAVDVVEGEGRRVRARLGDFSVGNETRFNQSLEAVTDSDDEVLLFFEVRGDCVCDALFSDDISDEFTASVWLVTRAESARERHDLAFLDFRLERFERFFQIFRRSVLEDENVRIRARKVERTRHVVFAVCAREHGDDYAWFKFGRSNNADNAAPLRNEVATHP